ncbi:hypothetical protein [Ruegeria marina]|uniref:Uncharacterized protein n=1 Tax=Ruegeria marina TaxID=639004 RepID=A0A1G7BFD5_9RHOB|nr:hypothetical protein [Ruegeria marina]SDE25754.1 hypothetical protein SAMN04488239_11677 [Ruegeria marina]
MVRFVFILFLLAACAPPGREFRGLPATRVDVGGSLFDVRVRGNLAEAIRLNPQYAPRFGPIRDRAGFAMAQVSGCEVEGVLGDQAVALGVLDCGARPGIWALPAAALRFDCVEIDQLANEGLKTPYVDFECTPF